METAKNEYEALCSLIRKYSHHYYVLSSPLVSDAEFDLAWRKLQQMESAHPEWVTPDSPTQYVGSDLRSGSRKSVHLKPMLSLGKVTDSSKLLEFVEGIHRKTGRRSAFMVEFKYDGLSISLIYTDGELTRAVTRGDGIEGEDVTENARMIRSIPKSISRPGLPHIFEVRGEVMMTYAAFDNINAQMKRGGRAEYSNPRNAASGILRGSSATACQMLTMYAWDAYNRDEDAEEEMHDTVLGNLKRLGFKVAGVWTAYTAQEVERYVELIGNTRGDLKFPIDGAVVKVIDRSLWSLLGATEREPRWAVAWKYATDERETIFRGVEWSASDTTGRLTPVAHFDEVEMYGTKCGKASLGSYTTFMERFSGIREGDMLIVTKANEIIPKVLRWYSAGGTGKAATTPVVCPVCGSPVKVDGAHCFCSRPDKHASARAAAEKPAMRSLPERINRYALADMSIVVSGEFTKRFTREQMNDLVEKAGGKLVKKVSGKTAFLVAGDVKPGTTKLAECESRGVPVISEDEFLRRIIG